MAKSHVCDGSVPMRNVVLVFSWLLTLIDTTVANAVLPMSLTSLRKRHDQFLEINL